MNYADAAKEYSLKYDFYILALTFTILGLSVQTAEFSDTKVISALELIGWLGLLISGVLGLLRMEQFPLLYQNLHSRQTYDEALSDSDKIKFDDFIKTKDTYIQDIYSWQKWLFIISLCCIMASRAFNPFLHVICH